MTSRPIFQMWLVLYKDQFPSLSIFIRWFFKNLFRSVNLIEGISSLVKRIKLRFTGTVKTQYPHGYITNILRKRKRCYTCEQNTVPATPESTVGQEAPITRMPLFCTLRAKGSRLIHAGFLRSSKQICNTD